MVVAKGKIRKQRFDHACYANETYDIGFCDGAIECLELHTGFKFIKIKADS